MKLYRALCNVLDSTGAFVAPGGKAQLDDETHAALFGAGAVERDPLDEAPPASAEERLAAILAIVPSLTVGDFTQAGQLRAEARRRLAGELGFEPTDDEIRAAGEAYAKAQAA